MKTLFAVSRLAVVLALLLGWAWTQGGQALASPSQTTSTLACSLGYWKNHTGNWGSTLYTPSQLIRDVFAPFPSASYTQGNSTLLQGLGFGGGSDLSGAARNLLRQSVAALLNAPSNPVAAIYPLTKSQVISQTNAALNSHNRETILNLATTLDGYNTRGSCSFISGLALTKTASPATYSETTDVITYTYAVTSTGNVKLGGPFTISDNKLGTVSCPAGALAPGISVTCTAKHSIAQADLDAGSITNTATASGNGATSNQSSATVTSSGATVLVDRTPPTSVTLVGFTADSGQGDVTWPTVIPVLGLVVSGGLLALRRRKERRGQDAR